MAQQEAQPAYKFGLVITDVADKAKVVKIVRAFYPDAAMRAILASVDGGKPVAELIFDQADEKKGIRQFRACRWPAPTWQRERSCWRTKIPSISSSSRPGSNHRREGGNRPIYSSETNRMSMLPLLKRLVDVESPNDIVASRFAPPVPGLDELLAWKNGFYAYRHGLHVFGRCTNPRWHSLETWNSPAGWIREYGDCAEGLFFFAEDTFGDQFAWDGDQIVRFLAETGECEEFASDLEDWLKQIVSNPQEELGLEVLKDWIRDNGPVPHGLHLFPRTPLVCGGALDPAEIVTLDPFENMGFKGSLAQQIANLPDGQQIELTVQPAPGAKARKK